MHDIESSVSTVCGRATAAPTSCATSAKICGLRNHLKRGSDNWDSLRDHVHEASSETKRVETQAYRNFGGTDDNSKVAPNHPYFPTPFTTIHIKVVHSHPRITDSRFNEVTRFTEVTTVSLEFDQTLWHWRFYRWTKCFKHP